MANELVARNGLRVSGSTFLGSVSLDQTLTATVLALDPSTNEVNYLSLSNADVHITGGTLTGTGNKDLQLVNSTGGTVTISDVNIETTGGTYNSSSGEITFTQNDGTTFNVNGWSYVESLSESNNTITVTLNDGSASTIVIDAVTGLGYDGDWALSGTSTGVSAPSVELPFITGATLDLATGTLELEINNGLENNFSITGFSTTNSDTFVTGATLAGGTLTLGRNDGNTVTESGFSFTTSGDTGTSTINLGGNLAIYGGEGIVSLDGGSGNIVLDLEDKGTAGTYGSASEVPVFETDAKGQVIGVTATTINITSSEVSDFTDASEAAIFTTANFADSTGAAGIDFTVDPGVSVTASLVNSSITVNGDTGTGSTIDLGSTLTFTSTDNSVDISSSAGTVDITVGAGVDTYITGGTYTDNTGVLTLTDNGGTVVTIDGNWNHFESASISDNVITFTSNTGQTSTVTVDAVTGVTYSSDWALEFNGTGNLGTTPFELPFITGGTYDSGTSTLTLGINGGLETDIDITGLDGSDTFVTGASATYSGATLDRNDGNSVSLDSEQTLRVTKTGSGTVFNVVPADYKAVHVEYTITEGTAARSGFFTAIFHNSTVEFSDFSTMDIGSFTTSTELSADSSGNVVFTGGASAVVIANTRAVAI
jgi:hypothetical protein